MEHRAHKNHKHKSKNTDEISSKFTYWFSLVTATEACLSVVTVASCWQTRHL